MLKDNELNHLFYSFILNIYELIFFICIWHQIKFWYESLKVILFRFLFNFRVQDFLKKTKIL